MPLAIPVSSSIELKMNPFTVPGRLTRNHAACGFDHPSILINH